MSKDWKEGSCNEKSGFLFNHECFQEPVAKCDLCQKPVCAEHFHMFGSSDRMCTSCARKRDRGPRGKKGNSATSRTQKTRGDHRDEPFDEPYFYGGYYFGTSYYDSYDRGVRSDPNDFTEADATSLSAEMDEDFENDMSES